MPDMSALLLGLLLTALYYGFVPMLSVAVAKRMQRKTYQIICVVSTAVLAIALFVAGELLFEGLRGSFAPAAFWGWVFYRIGCHIIDRRRTTTRTSEPVTRAKRTRPEGKPFPAWLRNLLAAVVILLVSVALAWCAMQLRHVGETPAATRNAAAPAASAPEANSDPAEWLDDILGALQRQKDGENVSPVIK